MRHWNMFAIDLIAGFGARRIRIEVGDDLVTMKVEIDPLVRTSPFRATQQSAVKYARGAEVIDREGEMERTQAHAPICARHVIVVEAFVPAQ